MQHPQSYFFIAFFPKSGIITLDSAADGYPGCRDQTDPEEYSR